MDRNRAAVEETRDIIRNEGGTAEALVGDMTSETDVRAMVAACVEAFGGVDVLHNNVGILKAGSPEDTTVDDWDLVLNVNCKGIFLPCKHALPHMRKAGSGAIINISSISGFRNLGASYIAYNTSKGSIVSFTRNLAATYAAEGIRANCILTRYHRHADGTRCNHSNSGKAEADIDFDGWQRHARPYSDETHGYGLGRGQGGTVFGE